MQGELLVADLPEDVHGLPRRPLEREGELVALHARLEGPPQRVLGAEETIRRHQPADPLVRPEVVVMREVMPQALARLAQLLRSRALPQLGPDRLPQTLALAERFGVVRARDHVLDPFAHQQTLEVRLANMKPP